MIPDDYRLELVEILLEVPLIGQEDDAKGRTALLAGIPQQGVMTRNPGSARGDVMIIVLQLEDSFSQFGDWRLLQLIDNALPSVQGIATGGKLQAMRAKLVSWNQDKSARKMHPADVALVHLFDLRQPVFTCIGMLPSQPALSGFGLNIPDFALLSYFCESLKDRATRDYKLWDRGAVRIFGSPLKFSDSLGITPEFVAQRAPKILNALARKHQIWAIYIEQEDDALEVWQDLQQIMPAPPSHHMVIIFGLPKNSHPPAGMLPLPQPTISTADIANWIEGIVKSLAWQHAEKIVERWTNIITSNYDGGTSLPIHEVFRDLVFYCNRLNENRTEEAFLAFLEEQE